MERNLLTYQPIKTVSFTHVAVCVCAALLAFAASAQRPDAPYSHARFDVTFNVSRTHIAPGEYSDINIEVRDSHGNPVQNALVDIGAGGGVFAGADDRFNQGRTDGQGRFSTRWISYSGDYSMKYVIDFRIYLGENLIYDTQTRGPIIEVGGQSFCGTPDPPRGNENGGGAFCGMTAMNIHTAVGSRIVRPGDRAPINVMVTDEGGRPVEGATVTIAFGGGYFEASNMPTITGATDKNGTFAQWWRTAAPEAYSSDFEYVYYVHATAPGYLDATATEELVVTVGNSQPDVPPIEPAPARLLVTTTVTPDRVEAGQGTTLRVTVTDVNGQPVVGATVRLGIGVGTFSQTGTREIAGLTDSHGGAFSAEWQSGDASQYPNELMFAYDVHVSKPGYEPVSALGEAFTVTPNMKKVTLPYIR